MNIRRLETGDPAALGALTFPRFRHLVAEPPADVVLLVAETGLGASGLAIVKVGPAGAAARLLSVFVPQLLRRQGIGLRLVREAAGVARQGGASSLSVAYSSALKGAPALEATLSRAGWEPARLVTMRIRGAACWADSAHEDWRFLFTRLDRGGFSLDDWRSVGEGDRATMRELLANGLVRADFAPFPLETQHIPELSLVLRRHGRVIGWVQGVPELGNSEAVFYVNGAVHADLARTGVLIAAIVDVSRRQSALMGPTSICVWQTDADNHAMQSFMKKRLEPRGPQQLDMFYERVCLL